jgi:hypothetical protein
VPRARTTTLVADALTPAALWPRALAPILTAALEAGEGCAATPVAASEARARTWAVPLLVNPVTADARALPPMLTVVLEAFAAVAESRVPPRTAAVVETATAGARQKSSSTS